MELISFLGLDPDAKKSARLSSAACRNAGEFRFVFVV